MKKNLKFIALGVIAALAVVSCNSDKFTINGDIDNLADQNVYLARDGENGSCISTPRGPITESSHLKAS